MILNGEWGFLRLNRLWFHICDTIGNIHILHTSYGLFTFDTSQYGPSSEEMHDYDFLEENVSVQVVFSHRFNWSIKPVLKDHPYHIWHMAWDHLLCLLLWTFYTGSTTFIPEWVLISDIFIWWSQNSWNVKITKPNTIKYVINTHYRKSTCQYIWRC